jgi:hypothetical protein
MQGPVEQALRSSVEEGAELPTPTGRARFTVQSLDTRGVTLLFGPKRTPTFFSWKCLEGIVDYLAGKSWVPVGANRDVRGNPETLDWYMKQHVVRQTANYVAVLLARAGVLELISETPSRVRLSSAWWVKSLE